jgi:phosphohistidine phosphatase SixA
MKSNTSFRTVLRHALLLLPALGVLTTAQGQALSGGNLLSALRTGGYVILMRHASSPRTAPEASQANPDNPERERQLDDVGRASARTFGESLRGLHIPIGQVLSSPTYRALQTLKLAQLGPVTTFVQLGDSGQSMQADTSGQRAAWLKSQAAQAPKPRTNTVIVTHFPNIMEAYEEAAPGLADGKALILHPDGRGGAPVVARVKIEDWAHLDAVP